MKEVYEKIRLNANYEEVVENVERLFRLRKERGSKLPYIILRMIKMDETQDDVEAFKARWEPFLEEHDEVAFSNYQTWNNTVENKRVDTPDGLRRLEEMKPEKLPPCRMIYKTLQVYYDGRATPCCYDYDCVMDVGNVKDQSIQEIWNGDKLRAVRQLHEDGRLHEISICNGCQEYIP